MEGIEQFDRTVEQFFFLHRSPFLTDVFFWLTQLGDPRVIAVLCISMGVVLFRHKRLSYILGLCVALIGALATSYILQVLIQRPRPPLSYHLIEVSGYSLPSIHATVATATYGFLCYMTWKLLRPPHHRIPWMTVLGVLIILVCFSRVYMGVHYPSDVLAGFALGCIFVWLGALMAKRYAKSNFRRAMRARTP